ncbi:MAG: hypothetical protein ACH350_07670 [Parachlamydiaceae bacterium]
MDQSGRMNTSRYKIQYRGSIFWLIFWLIFFFPIAFVLLLTDTSFEATGKIYTVQYNGSRFWLGFWVLFFFPIAFLLLFLNGLSMIIETPHFNTVD